MVRKINKLWVVFSGIAVLVFSCKENRLDVDVSGVKIEPVKILRMEKDLFSMNPDSVQAAVPFFIHKYGDFFSHFVAQVVSRRDIRDSSYAYRMKAFITDKDMLSTYKECVKKYPDLSSLEVGLTEAFRYALYHFPDKKAPKVYSLMSGFNYSVMTLDSVLAIGLEMYLGEKNPYYAILHPPMPLYRRRVMNEHYMLSDCVRGWLESEFEMPMSKSDFLSEIIRQGKLLYLHEAMLPGSSDTLRLSCTTLQLDWAKKNEYNVWAYMIEKKLLYSHNPEDLIKFTGEGPFTTSFGKESPPKMGSWIGLQIIRNYMNEHPEVTLKQLVGEKDAQLILTRAKYRPEA